MNRYLISLIALVVLIAWVFPSEVQKWQIAAAQNDLKDGQEARAVERLKAVSAAAPDDLQIQLRCLRGMFEADNRQEFETLGKQLLEKFQRNQKLAAVLAQGFHHFANHRQAYHQLLVAEDQAIDQLKRNRIAKIELDVWQVNNLSYFSFLANEDADFWYYCIKQVLPVQREINFAIYRSEALRLVGKPERATAILQQQLDRLETLQQQYKSRWQKDTMKWMSHRDWPNEEPEQLANQRIVLMNIQVLIARVAKQGWITSEGTTDLDLRERFRKAQMFDSIAPDLEIAGEGDARTMELFSVVNSPKQVCNELIQWATLFDTRGCLALANEDYQQAMADLDSCIEAITLVQALSESIDLWNSTEILDANGLAKLKQERRASWAAVYYHRLLLKQELGDDLIQQDQQRIQDLGFDPSQPIY